MPESNPVVTLRIHPAIGIARVGNSPDHYFIGPEVPGLFDPPDGGYKEEVQDGNALLSRVKRQAARFRVYAYGGDDEVPYEVTAPEVSISWTVHLANKKGEWDRFEGRAGEDLPLDARRPGAARNADVGDRASLVIDPRARSVSKPNASARLDGGSFLGVQVPLGEIRTDDDGRLLVLGGAGRAGSAEPGRLITNYANNDRWYDDTSDGPVTASVTLADGTVMEAVPSWVIVGPPDYAPALPNFVTMYDVALEAAVRREWLEVPERPSFTRDIYPVLARAVSLQWVSARALAGHGPRTAGHFPTAVAELASNGAEARPARERVVRVLRDPHLLAKVRKEKATEAERAVAVQQAEYRYMPSAAGDDGDARSGVPGTWMTLTALQYDLLRRWAAGDFEADWIGEEAVVRAGLPLAHAADRSAVGPADLDRAALESASGGSFFPGIEAGWIIRNPSVYREPFRFDHAVLGPGDVTKRMAVPWHADFFECRDHWWPWQRPDNVLTLTDFERLVELDRRLERLDPAGEQFRLLAEERAALWGRRAGWARSLPSTSPEGDNAMVTTWPNLGFVVGHRPDRTPFMIQGEPAFVETETMKYDDLTMPEYFYILVNIEEHPEFRPKARELARTFLAMADYGDANYAPFHYTEEAFDRRMKKIYDDLATSMYEPHWLDSGDLGDGRKVDRFSDAAVVENLRQKAPLNLVDGAWLQNIMKTGPCNEVQANLFAIWVDEAGNGKPEQNHCNVYETLLRSVNVYLPPIVSRPFIEEDLLPSGFDDAVFQMSVGLGPQELPELLGMTLYLEWEATPTLAPVARMLDKRGINPAFYRLHVAIDNIDSGHGALAKQAIKLYLTDVGEKGGDSAAQNHWQRIWNGYVAWATLGTFAKDLKNHLLLFDGKVPEGRRTYAEQRMAALVKRKAPVARQSHGSARLGDRLLNDLFDDPPALMEALATNLEGWIDPANPRDSRFFHQLISFTGPMYKVFTDEDQDVLLDWIESLRSSTPNGPRTGNVGLRMKQVLAKYRSRAAAESHHEDHTLPGEDGTERTVKEWFSERPEDIMRALERSKYIEKGSADNSSFFTEVVGPLGLMAGKLDSADVAVIRNWVDEGCPPPGAGRQAVAEAAYAREVAPMAPAPFSTRRRTIGYGSVH